MFNFSDRTKYRFLEILPGTLTWGTFILAIVLSFEVPMVAIVLVILFDLYWLFRVSYFVFYLIQSWGKYRNEINHEWYKELIRDFSKWNEYYHVIFLPTYKEPLSVIETTIKRLIDCHYDSKRMIIVLAGEGRDEQSFNKHADYIISNYQQYFFKIILTIHPVDLPDEIPGKGSNLNWSGHKVKDYIDVEQLAYDKIIVSSFDVDTVVHPEYFSCLTYKYLSHPNPERTSFQPAVLYNNNLWGSPALVRIAAMGTTFWLMTELARPERLFTFSSHSMSWQALVDVDFWDKRIVTEDSRIFLQCFLRYDGDYMVTPMYVPVSMDMVSAGGYLQSLKELYKQQRRWAWGIEHLPFMLWNFKKNSHIPFKKKFYYVWNLGEGMYTWATTPILITTLGHLPVLFTTQEIESRALIQNAPFVLEFLMQLAMVGIFVSALISLTLLPRRPDDKGPQTYLVMVLQWVLLPFMLIAFGSIPAIDAQTRLMLGKYLGFNVTKKVRS